MIHATEKYPVISIITIVFNMADKIEDTILSVINQIYSNIEYIIIDGGSTDGTLDIIEKYKDKISSWVSEPDSGIYNAMNKGLEKVTGDWVCFINAGDGLFDKNVISNIYNKTFFQNTQIDVLYGDSVVVYKNNERRTIKAEQTVNSLSKGPVFRHGAMFVRTAIHKKYKFKEEEKYKICADFDVIYHLFVDAFEFKYVDEIIMYFEQEGLSNNRIRCAKDNKMIVLSYKNTKKMKILHNIQILKAYILSFIIKPFFRLFAINV